MTVIKCKMCGGDVDMNSAKTYGTCKYCNSTMTLPRETGAHIANLFNRANELRRQNEFDKALQAYENILGFDTTDAEAHWGVVLSRYGIEYVEDPKTKKRIPTCHRVQYKSVLSDVDYLAALEYAPDDYTKELYIAEGNQINEIQKNIIAISSKEPPYDIFICYKETGENGSRTNDSVLAQELYYQLTNAGYKVFFSRITLESKLGQQYEPYIFAALNSAKIMLVIGTCKEHFEAVWVRNEWSRFLAIMENERQANTVTHRLLIPCYKNMTAYDLPESLSHFQAQDMSKIGFTQDLLHGIKKVIGIYNSGVNAGNLSDIFDSLFGASGTANKKLPWRIATPLIVALVVFIAIIVDAIDNNNTPAPPPRPQVVQPPIHPPQTVPKIVVPEIPTVTARETAPPETEAPWMPDYIPPLRGNPSEFIKDLDRQIELAYFEDDLAAAYGIFESAVEKIEFENPNEHNTLFKILERICRKEDIKSLTFLAGHGLDLNLLDNVGNPVLSQQTPSVAFLSEMFALGADPNQRSYYNHESALTRAIKQKKEDVAIFLIGKSDPEKLNFSELAGATAFHLACENELHGVISALLKAGVDIDKLGFAPKSGFSTLISYEGKTGLTIACESANAETVEFLLQKGADAKFTDANGNSLIHLTLRVKESNSLSVPQRDLIVADRIRILNLLVGAGADVNGKSQNGTAPLMMLVDVPNFVDERFLEVLIQSGADVSVRNDNGATPLHAAVEWSSQTTARFLLLNGADVNAEDDNGNTPLSVARRKNDSGMIALLLGAGAVE